MSYLLDLVKSFTPDELRQFRQLDLKGKEEIVRDAYATINRQNVFDESSLHTGLQLTKSHFDKINSVLLDKAVLFFGGTNVSDKYEFLLQKQLNGLILHELKVSEKRLLKAKDTERLKQLYEVAFYILARFNFNDFPVKQMSYYGNAFAGLLRPGNEEPKFKMLAKQEECLIRYRHSRREGATENGKSLKKLLQWQNEIKGKGWFEAEVAINLGISCYYEVDYCEQALHYLVEADKAARKVYNKLSDREKAFIIGMTALQLISLSRYPEAIAAYDELFAKFPAMAGARVYHPFQFVFVLLIVKDFATAQTVLKKYLDPILQNENARNFHFDILRLYAIYHLLKGETELAGKYLQRLLQFGKEDFTVLGDILFRLVHNVYCAQTGDLAMATDVLKKNIKYVDSKMDADVYEPYKKMFLELGKVIRFKSKNGTGGKPFPAHEIEQGKGLGRLYQDLIKLPLQK